MASLEHITGFVTAPGAVFTAVTMGATNSTTVRNFPTGRNAFLVTAWARNSVAGALRFRSPYLADQVQGIRLQNSPSVAGGAAVEPMLPYDSPEILHAQDVLTIDMTGSAVAGAIESFGALIYYDDLPGAPARFISLSELESRRVHWLPITTTHVAGVAGGYSAPVALNAGVGTMKANTDYALIGYVFSDTAAIQDLCSVAYQGVDTGNLTIGGPGNYANKEMTSRWFIELSKKTGRALIPVINSANAGGTIAQVVNDNIANTVTLTTLFAELR